MEDFTGHGRLSPPVHASGMYAYSRPVVHDYGGLEQMTASVHPLLHGSRTAHGAQVSGLSGPGGGGIETPATSNTPTENIPGAGTGPGTSPGGTTGAPTGTVDVSPGGSTGGGGTPGGTIGGGGGEGHLPFTGLAVGAVGAVGGAFVTAGAAMRRFVRRTPSSRF
jgi:hypothetical protein